MKGLDLSEDYYSTYCVEMIEKKFPAYNGRIAAGLVGEGSECYGFDDDISKDHDWGPGFCLWLTAEDFNTIGHDLQMEYERLPESFKGYKRLISQWGAGRVGVFEIGKFYQKYIGISSAPVTPEGWLYLPESFLSTCTNGRVFNDPLGEFTRIREDILNYYPEDVRLVKIAAKCMSCAQSGQYNYMRSIGRNEYFPAFFAEAKFCSDIMSMAFLLNKEYAPYYKWIHKAVQKLPILGQFIYDKILELINASDHKTKNDLIEIISLKIIEELQNQGLSDLKSSFLLDHGPVIHDKIKDEKLRKRDVWAG